MYRFFLIASMGCLIASKAAFAVDCDHLGGGIGLDTATATYDCTEQKRVVADRKLNAVYKVLSGKLKDNPDSGEDEKTELVMAQRQWIAFRDSECAFRASMDGGAPQWHPVNQSQCLIEMTKQRTDALQGYLDQADGR